MKKKMSKKLFVYIGMIAGLLAVLMGILVMTGAMGGNSFTVFGAPYKYDSGYATFGADFYTYVTNNAAEAAKASTTAAANLHEIAVLLKNVSGILLIAGGLFMLCFFGVQYAECEQAVLKEAPAEKPADESTEAADEFDAMAENLEKEV